MKQSPVYFAFLCALVGHGCGDGRRTEAEPAVTHQALAASDEAGEGERRLEETDARLEALARRLGQLPHTEQALSVVRAHQARVRKALAERP